MQKKPNKLGRKQMIIGMIFVSVSMMLFSPTGSFNPLKIGFYTSILTSLFSIPMTFFLIKKYLVKKEEK